MNWNMTTIGMLAASLAVSVAFFVGAGFFAIKKRAHRFGLALAIVLGVVGVLTLFLNPIPNIILGLSLDEARLESIRTRSLNQSEDVLFRMLGQPDASWTNEHGTFFTWRGTSPFWSMYPQDTMALASNGTITGIWSDD
jgi:hypothetical protein